jgi:hypothetical protein
MNHSRGVDIQPVRYASYTLLDNDLYPHFSVNIRCHMYASLRRVDAGPIQHEQEITQFSWYACFDIK